MSLLTKTFKTAALAAPLLLDTAAAYWPKRGLAYNDDLNIAGFGGYQYNGKDSMVNWQYNWDSTTGEKQPWAEYVPMLWGTQNYHTDQWMDHANYWLDHGGSGHLLAFNEPEQGGQANLSPADAANAYRQYMQPLGWKTNLGSPAVSNDGYEWMRQFLNECHDCKIDFLAIHWYNDHTQFGDFQNWVNSMCGLANGRQVWITEVSNHHYLSERNSQFLSPRGERRSPTDAYSTVRGLRLRRSAGRLPQAGHPLAR